MYALDYMKRWHFTPLMKPGELITPGAVIGSVQEGAFTHFILGGRGDQENIARLTEGDISLDEPLGQFESGRDIPGCHEWPVRFARPYKRKFAPAEPLVTGQRSIDFLFPLARGGTAIFPGGFGTGKTILEQSVAKFADVDIVVYVGCGERGNEMADMIAEFEELRDPWSGRPLRDRTVLVVNTSNMPVAAREASIYTAVTMAEYYRDMGYHVLFLADSLSRWAEALREISASLEEMPGEEGYPTYLASRLSAFFERAGVVETLNNRIGSLSMILSVSPPAGDPGLSAHHRRISHARHFPGAPQALSGHQLVSELFALCRRCGKTLPEQGFFGVEQSACAMPPDAAAGRIAPGGFGDRGCGGAPGCGPTADADR
jgi:V/A-type H+-transporting ATPase subunit A